MKIPFNKPQCVGREIEYMKEAIERNKLSGDGYFSGKVCSWLENTLDINKVLLTPSATHALELAAMLIDIQPGDEVVMPSFTFTSTANAFVMRGARPVFVDIREDSLNIDENMIENRLSSKTKVLTLIHYGGVACEMSIITSIVRKNHLLLIEDAAQAIGAKYKGKFLGTFGQMSAFSFHETKNIYCGEGGAILINDESYGARAEIIREKGTNRSQYFRGEARKYEWMDVGSSYLISDLSAAFLYGQLNRFNQIMRKRKILFNRYLKGLKKLQNEGYFRLPIIPEGAESNHHTFYILTESVKMRKQLEEALLKKGILAVTHYAPLHLSPMGRRYGYKPGDLPVTERIAETILRLPIYHGMTYNEQDLVMESINNFFYK